VQEAADAGAPGVAAVGTEPDGQEKQAAVGLSGGKSGGENGCGCGFGGAGGSSCWWLGAAGAAREKPVQKMARAAGPSRGSERSRTELGPQSRRHARIFAVLRKEQNNAGEKQPNY